MNSNLPSERMQGVARQLLAYETAALSSAESNLAAADRVCEALRRPLCTLAGTSGYRALLTRTLALAKAQVPGLSAVGVKPDGSLEGLEKLVIDQDSDAGVVLVSQLLGLLAALIGESLSLRILLDVWPDLKTFDAGPIGERAHDPTR